MSRQSRARKKARRDEAKRVRRTANYLRCGPKTGQASKKKKKYKKHKSNKCTEPKPTPKQKGKAKLSLRRRGKGRKGKAKRPLAKLRERRNMSSQDIKKRRQQLKTKHEESKVDSTIAKNSTR